MRISAGIVAACILAVGLLSGCGPMRTTVQPVLIEVADLEGQPVFGANVMMVYEPAGLYYGAAKPKESYHYMTTTDRAGIAQVALTTTRIDQTTDLTPPESRDELSGKKCLFRVSKGQLVDTQSLVIEPGSSVAGRYWTIRIIEVGRPRYVKVQ